MRSIIYKIFPSRKQRRQNTLAVRDAKRRPDRWMFMCVIILSLIGLFMVYESSVAIAMRDFSDQYYFVREQGKWFILGYIALILCSFIDYRIWKKFAVILLIISYILLAAVFIPGLGVRALGASRWIDMGIFIVQPAEVVKLALIVYLSSWLVVKKERGFFPFFLLLISVTALVVLQPDLGTAVVIVTILLSLYFYSGISLKYFLFFIPFVITAIIVLSLISPYRFQRLLTFFDYERDPLGSSYQIRQILIALGSGGLFGVGIGKSRQKFEFLPEANTDSIFAIIGEEFGFIGSLLFILLFVFLIWRGFRIAKRTKDPFGQLLALGIITWVGFQTALNLSAMVGLIPLTGVTLPLVSYGGSSLTVLLAAFGIVLNISKSNI